VAHSEEADTDFVIRRRPLALVLHAHDDVVADSVCVQRKDLEAPLQELLGHARKLLGAAGRQRALHGRQCVARRFDGEPPLYRVDALGSERVASHPELPERYAADRDEDAGGLPSREVDLHAASSRTSLMRLFIAPVRRRAYRSSLVSARRPFVAAPEPRIRIASCRRWFGICIGARLVKTAAAPGTERSLSAEA